MVSSLLATFPARPPQMGYARNVQTVEMKDESLMDGLQEPFISFPCNAPPRIRGRMTCKFQIYPCTTTSGGDIRARVGPDNSVVKDRVRRVGTNSVSPSHKLRVMPA